MNDKCDRREFLKLGAAGAIGLAGCATPFAKKTVPPWTGTDEIRCLLLHLGHNMWCEWLPEDVQKTAKILPRYVPDCELRSRDDLWRQATDHMAKRGYNMLVIDVGEALVYPSHPELAITGSWTPDRMRDEVIRLRGRGIEAIPKLNFSATHDGWLKDYHRMICTPKYYEVVRDVIRDVVEVFDTPRFIHLGWDEERAEWSGNRNYFVMRAGDLWWHDFLYTVKCAEDCGVRPWVWSDCGPHKPEYFDRCPKGVLQSPWYYDAYNAKLSMDKKENPHWWKLQNILDLDRHGFEQVPCGSNWVGHVRRHLKMDADDVMGLVVKFCRERVSAKSLKGFQMAPWASCDTEENLQKVLRGTDLLADALQKA